MPKSAMNQRSRRPAAKQVLGAQVAALQAGKKRPRRRAGRRQAGIQSLEAGIGVLRTLLDAGKPVRLKEVATARGMSSSKAHRYLVSLCRMGIAAQDTDEPAYRLGPYALEMAIACLNSIRPVKLASDSLEAISEEIGLTVALATWGNRGSTIVRIEESSRPVSMNVRAGTVAPLTRSASGLMFAAFLPSHVVDPIVAAELEALPAGQAREARRKLNRVLADVRRTGVASVTQALVSGADALATPIFDHRGRITLALLAVGASGTFSLDPEGAAAAVLTRHARAISAALGFRDLHATGAQRVPANEAA